MALAALRRLLTCPSSSSTCGMGGGGGASRSAGLRITAALMLYVYSIALANMQILHACSSCGVRHIFGAHTAASAASAKAAALQVTKCCRLHTKCTPHLSFDFGTCRGQLLDHRGQQLLKRLRSRETKGGESDQACKRSQPTSTQPLLCPIHTFSSWSSSLTASRVSIRSSAATSAASSTTAIAALHGAGRQQSWCC